MKPLSAALALVAAAAALLVPSAPLRAQTAPPSAATGAPTAWRPLIVVDPRAVLHAAQHPPARARKPAPHPHARATAAPGGEVFERYDTAPSPRPR